MYIPHLYREEDTQRLLDYMQAYNFVTIVSFETSQQLLNATHIPVTIKADGENITLYGHFAKANPQWRHLSSAEVLVIFTGPHAYISPTHYEKRESVPTWNYIAVHAYGTASTITYDDSPAELEALLADLITRHEASYLAQWNSLSLAYRMGMMKGIVGFKIVVNRLEGKTKLSQNKTHAEQASIIQSLLADSDSLAHAVGVEMQKRQIEYPTKP